MLYISWVFQVVILVLYKIKTTHSYLVCSHHTPDFIHLYTDMVKNFLKHIVGQNNALCKILIMHCGVPKMQTTIILWFLGLYPRLLSLTILTLFQKTLIYPCGGIPKLHYNCGAALCSVSSLTVMLISTVSHSWLYMCCCFPQCLISAFLYHVCLSTSNVVALISHILP